MLQKTVTRGKTKICGKILKQIIAEESTLKATIPENEHRPRGDGGDLKAHRL